MDAQEMGSKSHLPALSRSNVQEFDARVDSLISEKIVGFDEITVALCAAAALYAETRYLASGQKLSDHSKFGNALEAEIASYMAWKALHEMTETHEGFVSATLARFDDERRSVMAMVMTQVEEANRKLIELQQADIETTGRLKKTWAEWEESEARARNDLDRAAANIDHLRESAKEAGDRIVATDENIAAFKAAMLEEVRGSETRKLWRERDKESWFAFTLSAFMLFLFLLVIPAIGFYELDVVLSTLKRIGDAATAGIPAEATGTQLTVATISRLVVITFPLAMYFWVIRLVVRFNARSLTLHDDARQRQTMMDTYFILIERQAASAEERALILNALFRPAPGHGADSVEPPNFTEIIGKAGGKPG